MKTSFKNFKLAHDFYNFRGNYRYGTIGDKYGVTRSYSNGKNKDKIFKNGREIWYKVKNLRVKNLFLLSIKTQKKLRFFKKTKEGVSDLGYYKAKYFYENFIILKKI